jgi:hypothetical protein
MQLSELEIKACNLIDDFLEKLEGRQVKFFDTYAKPPEYYIAKELMDKYNLISYRAPGNKMSIVDITTNGLKIKPIGGMKNFVCSINQKVETKDVKDKMEYDKLQAEVILIQNQMFDYDKTKRRAARGELVAIIAVIVSVLGFFLQWLLSKK